MNPGGVRIGTAEIYRALAAVPEVVDAVVRHVPAHVVAVTGVPYTISGKKVEKAVAAMIAGESVANRDALADPAVLDQYADLPLPS